jgi:hypothetical protein
MTAQLTPTRPEHKAPAGRYRRARNTAVIIASVAALIATGGYVATTTIGPDAIPPTSATSADVNPSAQALRELHDSVAGQYGSRSAADATVNPSARVTRELRQSVAGQYGSHPTSDATVNPSAETMRELRDSVTGQYGSHPTSDATVNPSARIRRELHDSVTGQYGHAR